MRTLSTSKRLAQRQLSSNTTIVLKVFVWSLISAIFKTYRIFMTRYVLTPVCDIDQSLVMV